jgi:hypothetical protein
MSYVQTKSGALSPNLIFLGFNIANATKIAVLKASAQIRQGKPKLPACN